MLEESNLALECEPPEKSNIAGRGDQSTSVKQSSLKYCSDGENDYFECLKILLDTGFGSRKDLLPTSGRHRAEARKVARCLKV